MEPVLAQGGARKKVKVKALHSNAQKLGTEEERIPPVSLGEMNPAPSVMQPGPPFMGPAYPPAGFLPPFLPLWGYVPPQGVVRSGLYPDVPEFSVSAGGVQEGQLGETSGQPVGGNVNDGSQFPVAGPADQCAGKVDQCGPPGLLTVNMREVRDENVNMREVRAENVNPRDVRADNVISMEVQAENVNTREVRAEHVYPESENGGDVVYENLVEINKTVFVPEHVVAVSGDQGDHVEKPAVLNEYDDCTPKRNYRKTPFPLLSSSMNGESSPEFQVRILNVTKYKFIFLEFVKIAYEKYIVIRLFYDRWVLGRMTVQG